MTAKKEIIKKKVDRCCEYCGHRRSASDSAFTEEACDYWLIYFRKLADWDVRKDFCSKFFLGDEINYEITKK